MKANEITKQLPRVLQLRFESLGRYVNEIVAEEQERRGIADEAQELPKDRMEFIHLMAFVYVLDGFLRAGTKAAKQAAQVFEELDMKGFAVGRELFTSTSEATMRGQVLADRLRQTLEDTRYARMIAEAPTLKRLVRRLVREAITEARRDQ